MNDWHFTHVPDEPRTIGFSSGMVYCKACGALLRSERGVGLAARVTTPCEPIRLDFRGTSAASDVPVGFVAASSEPSAAPA